MLFLFIIFGSLTFVTLNKKTLFYQTMPQACIRCMRDAKNNVKGTEEGIMKNNNFALAGGDLLAVT